MGYIYLNMLVFLCHRIFLCLVRMVLRLLLSTSCRLFRRSIFFPLAFLLLAKFLLFLRLLGHHYLLRSMLLIVFQLVCLAPLSRILCYILLIHFWNSLLKTSFQAFQKMLDVYYLQLRLCLLFLSIFDSLQVLFLLDVFLLIGMAQVGAFLLLWIILMGRFLVLMGHLVWFCGHVP